MVAVARRHYPTTLPALARERAFRHFRDFVPLMWPVIEPGNELVWGWPLDAICDHLEAITTGDIRDLIINCPPRFLKSSLVSVLWPAWEWLHKPSLRYLTASYAKQLAIRDAVRTRRVLVSGLYQELNRDENGQQRFRLTGDQNQKSRYENDQAGHRICTSPDSGATGEGGDRVMVDDPHNVKEAQSELARRTVIEWWRLAMSTRRNDPKTSARIVIMQRVHENDLTGECLRSGLYEHLCLPLLYEKSHPTKSKTSLHFVDPRRKEGQLLMPDRIGPTEADAMRIDLGTYGFLGQAQQRPSAPEGNILLRKFFRMYDLEPPLSEADKVYTSWDCTFGDGEGKGRQLKPKQERSWVVGQVWAKFGSRSVLYDEVRGQWDIVATIKQMLALKVKWHQATAHLIENKANGPAIEAQLRDSVPGILLVEPKGSKIQRAYAVAPYCEAGNVWIPSPRLAPWIDEWIDEIASFPFGKAEDRVDTMTQALIHEHVTGAGRSVNALMKMVGLQRGD